MRPTAAPEQTVQIESPDGVSLVGTFWGAEKPSSPALLLLHQWQSDRHSYDEFARRMNLSGFTVLSIDGRGFGESVKRADGSEVLAGRTDADVKAMLGDIDAAIGYLEKQPNVNLKRIGIVGASYGSSLAIIYAADHPEIVTVGLLSPGISYFGNMPIKAAVTKFGKDSPIMFLAAKDDPDSDSAVSELMKLADNNSPWSVEQFERGGHGTALFKVGADRRLQKFLMDQLSRADQ
jgi:dienelactone hydrolase